MTHEEENLFMTNSRRPKVKRIRLTQSELRAAIRRASENVKTWAIWDDPKAHPRSDVPPMLER